jgi:hypothetical protein
VVNEGASPYSSSIFHNNPPPNQTIDFFYFSIFIFENSIKLDKKWKRLIIIRQDAKKKFRSLLSGPCFLPSLKSRPLLITTRFPTYAPPHSGKHLHHPHIYTVNIYILIIIIIIIMLKENTFDGHWKKNLPLSAVAGYGWT